MSEVNNEGFHAKGWKEEEYPCWQCGSLPCECVKMVSSNPHADSETHIVLPDVEVPPKPKPPTTHEYTRGDWKPEMDAQLDHSWTKGYLACAGTELKAYRPNRVPMWGTLLFAGFFLFLMVFQPIYNLNHTIKQELIPVVKELSAKLK